MASSTSWDNAVYAQAPSPVVTTTSNRRRRTFLWLGLGLFLIIAVALIVGLVVWRLTRCSVEPLDTDTNECLLTPCGSGGTCTDAVNGYMCGCADGFTGANCETNIDESNSTPTVEPLDTDTNECLSTPCGSGGTCTDAANGYTCDCADGFTGANCETNIDESSSTPTVEPLDTDTNECLSTPCGSRGTCTDAVNGYTCDCAGGFTGTNCETNIDECSSTPCQGAGSSCTDDVNGYTCACVNGTSGGNCEIVCTTDGGSCSAGSTCCSGICPIRGHNAQTCAECLIKDQKTCLFNSDCCLDPGANLYLKCKRQDRCEECGDKKLNEECDVSKQCCEGLRCDRKLPQGSKNGTCVVCNRLHVGDPCTSHSDCCTDFECDPGTNECKICSEDEYDKDCNVDTDCECGFICIAAKCRCATGNVGDGCTEDHDCCQPYSCSPTTLQCYAPP